MNSSRRSFSSSLTGPPRRSLTSSYGEAATMAILINRYETKYPTDTKARTTAPPVISSMKPVPPPTFPLTGMVDISPRTSIVFNAPYDDQQFGRLQMTNNSGRAIGFAVKATNTKRLSVSPSHGILQPDGSITIAVGARLFGLGRT